MFKMMKMAFAAAAVLAAAETAAVIDVIKDCGAKGDGVTDSHGWRR